MSPALMAIADVLRLATNSILANPDFMIFSNQNAPRPAGQYGDIDYLSDQGIGWERSDYSDFGIDSIQQNISGYRQIGFSLGFYRDSAGDNARKVRTGFIRESINQSLRLAGIGLLQRSEVRNISEPLESSWEERAQFDIFISVIGSDSDILSTIGSVDIASRFEIVDRIVEDNIVVP